MRLAAFAAKDLALVGLYNDLADRILDRLAAELVAQDRDRDWRDRLDGPVGPPLTLLLGRMQPWSTWRIRWTRWIGRSRWRPGAAASATS